MSRTAAMVQSAAQSAAVPRLQGECLKEAIVFRLVRHSCACRPGPPGFFSEAPGTDEIVYLTRAQHILHWEYPQAVYIGAMRDGINIFLAASIFLFGTGIGGASGLFFACSLGQVVLAFGFAYSLWGRRAAIWAALVMAALPIEITLAGGLGPDPYLGFVITCSR